MEKILANKVSRFLKAEMKRMGITYTDLAVLLVEQGLNETEASITSKLARGTFPATFFIATLKALKIDTLRVNDI